MNSSNKYKDLIGNCNYLMPNELRYKKVKNDISFTDINGLKIIHWNLRSIAENFELLIMLLSNINADFDIILLSELWVSKSIDLKIYEELFKLPNYDCIVKSSCLNRASGVGMFIKKDIKYTMMDINMTCNDCAFIKINCLKKIQNLIIGVIYKSPSIDINMFVIDLDLTLRELSKGKTKLIIGGDWNVDIRKEKDNNTINFIDCLKNNGFMYTITLVTHCNEKKPVKDFNFTGSTIDNYITNLVDQKSCLES